MKGCADCAQPGHRSTRFRAIHAGEAQRFCRALNAWVSIEPYLSQSIPPGQIPSPPGPHTTTQGQTQCASPCCPWRPSCCCWRPRSHGPLQATNEELAGPQTLTSEARRRCRRRPRLTALPRPQFDRAPLSPARPSPALPYPCIIPAGHKGGAQPPEAQADRAVHRRRLRRRQHRLLWRVVAHFPTGCLRGQPRGLSCPAPRRIGRPRPVAGKQQSSGLSSARWPPNAC